MEPVDNVAPGGVSASAVMIWRTPRWARNLNLCVMALMAFLGVFIAFTADVIWAIVMPIACVWMLVALAGEYRQRIELRGLSLIIRRSVYRKDIHLDAGDIRAVTATADGVRIERAEGSPIFSPIALRLRWMKADMADLVARQIMAGITQTRTTA